MSLGITLVIVIFSILILVGIVIIGIYNKILFRKKRVLDKFNSIISETVVLLFLAIVYKVSPDFTV